LQLSDSKANRLLALFADMATCRKCALHLERNFVVFGDGNHDAHIMLVGEAPGVTEDFVGLPFTGKSGEVLNKALEAAGMSRQDVYISNVVHCRPPNNRDPHKEEILSCIGYLYSQIDIIRPSIICCLGRVAARALMKEPASRSLKSLMNIIKDVLILDKFTVPVIATYHPSYILRDKTKLPQFIDDLRSLKQYL